jgi:hypothetical protein
MRSILPPKVWAHFGPAGCALILGFVCFQAILFRGEQFAYRDAAHFYYPLYLRVQQEWSAHRWPLWDPGQNGGVPLLGMPMAAVLYPGKVLFAVFAYPWAVRLYTVVHVVVAWAGMFFLTRTWQQSTTAAGLAALAYAFGAPVLFQYCNIIYLVGAAWVPWGFLALERLLRRQRRPALLGLAVVLAFQVLGGDPEAAYLILLSGGGYALVLAASGAAKPGASPSHRHVRWWWWCGALLFVWVGLTLAVALVAPRSPAAMAWLPGGAVGGGLAGLACLWAWRRRAPHARLGPMLAALAGAAALAAALTAAHLIPALEYAASTRRAADGPPGQIYGFCVEPYRLAEAAWPYAFGRFGPENTSWVQAVPPASQRQFWTPSLYLGALTLMLALGGFGFGLPGGPPWRTWLSMVALVALAGSFGRFGGPLWLARWLPGVAAVLGPHDPGIGVDRDDGFLGDGAGCVYGLLAALLPGFGLFRYPAKLLTFAAVAVAGLAGSGWDRLAEGATRVPRRAGLAALAATLAALVLVLAGHAPLIAWLSRQLPADVEFGPADPQAALAATVRGLIHGGLVFALGLFVAKLASRRPRCAGGLALGLMTLDLGLAQAPLIWTVPQEDFETMPRAASLIAAAERAGPGSSTAPGPFRFHRMDMAFPPEKLRNSSSRRLHAVTAWQRDTLAPHYGLPLGIELTYVPGLLESAEYAAFFGSRLATARDAQAGIAGPPVYGFPRRGFDLWNTRYLVMAVSSNGWLGEEAGFVRLYPPPAVAADAQQTRRWIAREDWQLLQSRLAYPRAWLVHDVRVRPPVRGQGDPAGRELMQDLVYQANRLWSIPGRPAYDPHVTAFVETDQPQGLAEHVARIPPIPGESVVITRFEPQRVELVAELKRPGLVILADAYSPGWGLTIDGVAAPIHRTNRLMRGAAVKAGRHALVYAYDPASFRIGLALSIVGLLLLAALVPWARSARQ